MMISVRKTFNAIEMKNVLATENSYIIIARKSSLQMDIRQSLCHAYYLYIRFPKLDFLRNFYFLKV